MRRKKRILTIVPATGWYAVYALEEPDEDGRLYTRHPLAVWALVEEDGLTYVDGIDMAFVGATGLELCSDAPSFLGYDTQETFDHGFWTREAEGYRRHVAATETRGDST